MSFADDILSDGLRKTLGPILPPRQHEPGEAGPGSSIQGYLEEGSSARCLERVHELLLADKLATFQLRRRIRCRLKHWRQPVLPSCEATVHPGGKWSSGNCRTVRDSGKCALCDYSLTTVRPKTAYAKHAQSLGFTGVYEGVAERGGFEPPVGLSPLTLSRRVR
jgi:hypothetical protein